MSCGDGTKRCENNTLKQNFKNACDEYVRVFCARHEIDIEYELENDHVWVANQPGTVACIGDMFVNMEDIRYDVDRRIPSDMFEKWYWEALDRAEMNVKYLNYKSFCEGCPDPISTEQMQRIREARKNLNEAKRIFEDAVNKFRLR